MKPWLLQFRMHLVGFIREPAAAAFNLAVPLFIVGFQALAFGDVEIGDALPGLRVVDVLPLSASLMYTMTLGLFGVSIGIAAMIEARTLAGSRLRVGGVSSVVSAYIAVLLVLLFAGVGLTMVVARALWSVSWPDHVLAFPVAVLVAAGAFYGLGLLVASTIASPRSAQAVASALFFPILFLSGALFPFESFPGSLQAVAKALPGVHAYDVMAAAYLPDQSFPILSLTYLAVLSTVSVGWALAVFVRREDL